MFSNSKLPIHLILNSFGGRKIKTYDTTFGTYLK